MITIRNRQRTVALDVQKLERDVQRILEKLRYAGYDIGILIVNDKAMCAYNRDYRGKDNPTDILSFPYHPALKPGQRVNPVSSDDKNLGDIILNAPYIARVADDLGVALDSHVQALIVHGVLHLLGYDHITDDDYAVMARKEKALIAFLAQSESL